MENQLKIVGFFRKKPVVNRPANRSHIPVHKIRKVLLCESANETTDGPVHLLTKKFEEIQGVSTVIPTSDDDRIFYAMRPFRKGFSRFVWKRDPEETNLITIVLLKNFDHWILLSAWYGKQAAKEPWDRRANGFSKTFWTCHAFVEKCEEYYKDTVITECPWPLN